MSDSLCTLLTRLEVVPADAEEVLRTMPSPDGNPELWWLLERSRQVLVRHLASRESEPAWEPIPPLPTTLGLFPIHLILVSLAAVRERQQAFGVPDDFYGEELCAWIKLKPGATATEDDIKAFCRDRITHFKIPRQVRFVDSYPMTVTGKVQKFVMREMMTKELASNAAEPCMNRG